MINPLHLNMGMHILLNVLNTFPKVLPKKLRTALVGDHFFYSGDLHLLSKGVNVRRN